MTHTNPQKINEGGMAQDEGSAYEALLMEYACGVLCDHLALAVSSHLALMPGARRTVAMYERLGGTLMQQECEPVAMGAGALHAVLGRLDCARTAAACNPPRQEYAPFPGIDMPEPLCRFLALQGVTPGTAGAGTRPRWRRVYPGIRALDLTSGRTGPYAALVRMAPGRRVPFHHHRGRELTLVLEGALRDESGMHGRGTLIVLEGLTHHTPEADTYAGCVCLIVSEEPVIPAHHIARLLARFLPR